MDGMTVRESAAARLGADQQALARDITATLYAELPELEARYGERGRTRCLEDMNFNVEHLRPAVELGEPHLFADYVRWLDGLLRARGIATDEIVRSLTIMERLVTQQFPSAEADAVRPAISAGLDVLAGRGR